MARNNISNSNGAAAARGFRALFAIVLAMGLCLIASPAWAPAPYNGYAAGEITLSGVPTRVEILRFSTVPNAGPGIHIVAGSFPAGSSPVAVAVSKEGDRVAVTHAGPGSGDGHVTLIATGTNTVTGTINLAPNRPSGAVFLPNNELWVAASSSGGTSGNVTIIGEAPPHQQVGTIPLSFPPTAIASTPDGGSVFVIGGSGPLNVVEIDMSRRTQVGSPFSSGGGWPL